MLYLFLLIDSIYVMYDEFIKLFITKWCDYFLSWSWIEVTRDLYPPSWTQTRGLYEIYR